MQTYNKEEIIKKVCENIAEGISLRKTCKEKGMPNKSTILRWIDEDENFATIIARARDYQAESLFDDMMDITEKVISGEIEPNAARVAIWAKQWQASKLKPKKYGDKLELAGDPTSPLQVQIVRYGNNNTSE